MLVEKLHASQKKSNDGRHEWWRMSARNPGGKRIAPTLAKAHVRKAAAIYTLKAAFRQYFKAYKDMEVRTMSGDGDLNSFCAGKREGTRSFAGKSQIRQKIAQKKTHQGITPSSIHFFQRLLNQNLKISCNP